MQITPIIQVRSRSIVVYNQFERVPGIRSNAEIAATKKLREQETYTGRLTPGAKKRLTRAIENITQAAFFKQNVYKFIPMGAAKSVKAKFSLNFITLTIHSPQKMIKGKEGHKLCLMPLLKWIHDNYNQNLLYVWKAELQQRGQLHYHLTTNTYIPHEKLLEKWGDLNYRAGYLAQWFSKNLLLKTNKNGERVMNYPTNLTDIHSVYRVQDMAKYLKKCIAPTKKHKDGSLTAEYAKELQNAAEIGGKVWDCALKLKKEKFFTIDVGGEYFNREIIGIQQEAKKPGNKVIHTDNCSVYCFKRPAYELLCDYFYKEYIEFYKKLSEKVSPKINIDVDIGSFSAS